MNSKALILSIGITASAAILVLWTNPSLAHDTTYALCETENDTVRVYNSNGQTLMRAYNRQQNVVWMNRTPVSVETITQGTVYTNTRGEQTVKVLVNSGTNRCTIQVGNRSPQQGNLLAYKPNSEATLAQVRQLYPEQVAELESDCQAPGTLSVLPYQNQGQPQRANFICWSPPEANGARSGEWLGRLPLTANDPAFSKPMTCPPGDTQCQANLSLMQSHYPQQLQQAEFTCAEKMELCFLHRDSRGLIFAVGSRQPVCMTRMATALDTWKIQPAWISPWAPCQF